MTARDWISDRRALVGAATEGPWVVGDRDHIQGASRCACRPEYGPLVWEGRRDINGVQMMTHIHRASEPRHDSDDTTIYSTSLPYPEIVALSTTEYVTIQPGDAALIADARTSLPAALDALEAVLRDVARQPDSDYYLSEWERGYRAAMLEVERLITTALEPTP